MMSIRVISLLVLGATVAVGGLKCNEGFNATLGGIPLYHWEENTCAASSNCFGQQLLFKVTNLDIVMRYGGCISSAYGDLLKCENLFGADSTQDPAALLNLIPDLDQKFALLAQSFAADAMGQLEILFSGGKGSKEFIAGVIKFIGNIGFKTTKLQELEIPLANLFKASLGGVESNIATATEALLTAIGNLDTEEAAITNQIYAFLGNFLDTTQIDEIKASPMYSPLITRVPGLIKSMIPDSWESASWYGAIFEILGELQISNPKQSVTDIVATIKATANIPAEVATYTDPIFNTLPELVQQLVNGNFTYASYWSLELLKEFSETDANTEAMKTAMSNFLSGLGLTTLLPPDVMTTIQYLPGLFYKIFPANKTLIQEVYGKITTGFTYFDFSDPSSTAPATNMSIFIIDLINKIAPGTIQQPSFNATLIINFSKLFYDLLSDYTPKLDIFFTTLKTGFTNFPTIDAGQIITDLVTKLGGTMPSEVEPLLSNMQNVINKAIAMPFDAAQLYTAMSEVVTQYKTAFPDSKFPDIVQRYINYIKAVTEGTLAPEQIANEAQLISIDLQLALFGLMDFDQDALYKALLDAFPAYGTFINLMKALDPADVKALYTNFMTWVTTCGTGCNATSLTAAMKPTIVTITSKLGDVTKELRHLVAPEACKFQECDTDLCNSHTAIDDAESVTKKPDEKVTTGKPGVSQKPITTTSGSNKVVSSRVLLNSAILLLMSKALFG